MCFVIAGLVVNVDRNAVEWCNGNVEYGSLEASLAEGELSSSRACIYLRGKNMSLYNIGLDESYWKY